MKKILYFFIFSTLNFSCIFLNDPDYFMRKAFETIREVGSEKSLYCDKDGVYMIYYYDNNKHLQIGLVDKLQNDESYSEVMSRLQKETTIIYDIFLQKISSSSKFKDFKGIEFRYYLDISDQVFMLNKLVVDVDGEVQMLVNSQLREAFDNTNLIYYTEDITY